ncbi:PAAR domain-containing protein [Paraburkholderia sp. SIMBA_030]|uniref:PAAR domain-containing protein n=1 Tax=Paraburkholderia sp. SIMBA_030 TaxID=3085773 RepID=UPI00397CFF1D
MSNDQHKEVPTDLFATICSLTERGGRVTTATSGLEVIGLGIARVGDVLTYEDGSEAAIIDGAGSAAMRDDAPFALVGSRLNNGDTITETLQDEWGITVRGGEQIPSQIEPAWTLPPTVAIQDGSTHA